MLSICIHLIKNGGYGFSFDLKNNLNIIKELQNINSKYFAAGIDKKAKVLDYQLEVIKHRAKYI